MIGNFSNSSSVLYVIGNGFDLWHGIPSSFRDFKSYVRNNNPHVFEAVELYLNAGPDWSDVESALAETDVDSILDENSIFMLPYSSEDWRDSANHDFQYEVGLTLERLSKDLRALLRDWIRSLKIPCPGYAGNLLKRLDKKAFFLSFNYTSTLESLYKISRSNVLHIHGYVESEDCPLVFGHSFVPASRRPIFNNPESIDFRLLEASSIVDNYFSETFKKSNQIISSNRCFFDGLSGVREVHVLGHSLSEVDSCYFEELIKIPGFDRVCWFVACRKEDEFCAKIGRMMSFGVKKDKIRTVLWNFYSDSCRGLFW